MQFARESAKPEEAGEAEESMECASLTSEESLSPLQTVIVVGPNADGDLGEVSVEVTASVNPLTVPPGVEHPVDPPASKVAPQSPVSRGKEDHDTEPDPEAIVASLKDNQPDPPHARSVHAENIVDQEVSQIQPNTHTVYLDCPGLGGSQLFSESAEHVLTAPKVGNRHQVYGPTLAPADTFLQSQVQIARGVTVGVHTFSQLMFDIVDVEREWAKVCPVDAHTILHRSTEVVRAARRLPAHRLEPHAEFSAGVFWKFFAFHPDPVSLLLSWFGLCRPPAVHPKQIVLRGFSAGSYVGAAVALIACRLTQSFRMHVTLGGVSMSQATLVHLCQLSARKFDTAPQHHVRFVHFLADQLCRWQPTPLAEWLIQHMHYTLVQTSVDWMSRDQHEYGHLLQVDLPRGAWDAHSAWLVGCRALARNSTLALSWTCCILMTMNSVGKS